MTMERQQSPSHGASASSGFDPRRYLQVVIRHFWVILVIFALVVAAGYFYSSRQPEVYRAEATLMIQPSPPSLIGGNSDPSVMMWTAFLDAQRYRTTQNRIITSRRLLEDVAERLDLYHDRAFLNLLDIEDDEVLNARLAAADPVPRLRSMVGVVPEDGTMMVGIEVRGRDPELVANVANTVAQAYAEYNYSQRIASGADAEDWVRLQFDNVQTELEDSERALYEFLRENNLLSVSIDSSFSLVGRELEAVQTRLTEVQFELDRRANSMAQIRRVQESGDYLGAGITDVVENELIQTLKQQLVELESERELLSATYLENHPQMQSNERRISLVRAALEREIQNELRGLRLDYESAQNLASTLEAKLTSAYSDAMGLGEKELEYQRMLRDVEANRQLFSTLESRLKEIELQNELEPNNVQVMERAMAPKAPVSASASQTILLSVGLGLLLGIGVAFLLEFLDNTVKTQEQLEVKFGLPFLGLVPSMRTVSGTKATKRGPIRGEEYNPDTFAFDYPRSNVAEACRSIRTNLMFLATEKPIERLLVTSPGPLEGKTSTAVSLATVIAQSGRSVLIIDNDMRRPRLHKALDKENRMGLTDLLLGEKTAEEVIEPTKITGVSMLPCGPLPPNPTELLYTDRYRNTIEMLDGLFDVLIFDSAPINPVTDSTVLSSLVDGVVLVVRAGKTRKELLARAIDQLDGVDANILGAVLNDVDINDKRYGYYYYYYQHYGQYYGSEDEEMLDQPLM